MQIKNNKTERVFSGLRPARMHKVEDPWNFGVHKPKTFNFLE